MRLRLPAPTSKKIGSGSGAALKVAAPAAPAPGSATLTTTSTFFFQPFFSKNSANYFVFLLHNHFTQPFFPSPFITLLLPTTNYSQSFLFSSPPLISCLTFTLPAIFWIGLFIFHFQVSARVFRVLCIVCDIGHLFYLSVLRSRHFFG